MIRYAVSRALFDPVSEKEGKVVSKNVWKQCMPMLNISNSLVEADEEVVHSVKNTLKINMKETLSSKLRTVDFGGQDNISRLLESKFMDVNESLFYLQNYFWDITISNTGIRNIVDNSTLDCAGAITDQLMYEIYEID